MELKPGYKQTEVGSIPSDWDVKRLGELGTVVRGGSPRPAGDPRYFDGSYIPWLTVAALTTVPSHQLHIRDTFGFLTEEGSKRSRTLIAGTLIIANSGATLGVAKLLNITCCANDGIAALVEQKLGDKEFLCQYINTQTTKLREDIATGNGQPNLNTGIVRGIAVPFPPEKEQSAIAGVLNDVDALLAAQDALIEKKRAIKHGAMQELLTGQRRLPGFSRKWEVKRLEDLAEIDPENLRANTANDYSFNYISLEDVDSGALRGHSGQIFATAPSRARRKLRVGDVLVSTVRPNLKSHLLFSEKGNDWVCSTGFSVVRCFTGLSLPSFVFMHLFSAGISNQIDALLSGSNYPAINSRDIKKLTIPVPAYKEQVAISEALSDMDAEITVLETQRTKIAKLKQGMMQALLAGRIRLMEPVQRTEPSANVVPFKKRRDAQGVPAVKVTGDKQANVHFRRSVFAAEIVDQLHNEPTFGHVKFEKLIFLAEHMCKVDTGSNYHRDAAGPYDNRALRSIDSQLKKQKWFDAQRDGGRYQYVPLGKHGEHKEYFDRYYADIRTRLDEIIATFRTAKTDQCEIVATLYGAWDDLINQGELVTDEAILDQVLNHWHDKKREISVERWRKALEWMREKDYVPAGASRA